LAANEKILDIPAIDMTDGGTQGRAPDAATNEPPARVSRSTPRNRPSASRSAPRRGRVASGGVGRSFPAPGPAPTDALIERITVTLDALAGALRAQRTDRAALEERIERIRDMLSR
jgi:hypothetical protein